MTLEHVQMFPLSRLPVLTMTAEDVCCLHWPVDPDELSPRLPAPLDLSLFDGTAWLSVVAFRATGVRPRGLPSSRGRSFPQLRLQTYVWHQGTPGRYFFSIDASDRLVAHLFRLTSRMPYFTADSHIERDGRAIRFDSRREQIGAPSATFETTVTVDGGTDGSGVLDGGDRDRWFVGHHRVFGAVGGTLWALDIDRETPSFRSATATIEENTLFEAAGVPSPTADPTVRYHRAWPMHASRPWRIRS
ncbi:YqjF family protein [Halogranum rubrum]|nr:DUF2071 domain-containing protein [Halogranum rubrum]